MEISGRELWTVIHGMALGALFLLSFAGGLAGLYSLRPAWVTVEGLKERLSRLKIGMWAMAAVAWATVLTGTYIIYPWYRAAPPEGTADLSAFPRSLLLSSPATSSWHTFGMEWKEHVAWIAPIAATVVAYAVSAYGAQLAAYPRIRRALTWFFVVGFATAGVAGMFGALINKVAPVR
ncbi:MAG: hypothetical protein ACRDG5_01480 [Anaerolineales bacterium]